MSNPLVAPRLPLSESQARLARMPQAYFNANELKLLGRDENGKLIGKRGISIEDAHAQLAPLDMEPHYSFYIESIECFDPSLQQALGVAGRMLATAQNGTLAPRRRTYESMLAAGAMFEEVQDWGPISKATIAARCEQVVYCQAGTSYTLGRLAKYYPRKDRDVSALKPVMYQEARESIKRCGLVMDSYEPLAIVDGVDTVSVNPDSDNGFPFMSKWSNELTHLPIITKALEIQASIQEAYEKDSKKGVWRWLRAMEASPETLKYVCLKGKCKADPYKKEKLLSKQLRFYNAFPRQIMLNLFRVTQVMDRHAKHMSSSDLRLKSGIGLSLVRDGAQQLVDALEKSVQEDGVGYTHVGDDSWVVWEYEGKYYLFSVDCSSFDLTQEHAVTEQVHIAIRDELAKIHAPTAQLWYAYARERCVAVVNSQVYRWKHAGPSGFPLQSKVNDVLMDVYLRRVIGELTAVILRGGKVERASVAGALEKVGKGMGLIARLEDYYEVEASSLVEALEKQPFLYLGYYFYSEEGRVYVVGDLNRQLAQVQYPNSFWVDKKDLKKMEGVRLAGIFISLGRPPAALAPAFDSYRRVVASLLRRLLDDPTDALRWLPQNAFVGVSGEDVSSLRGLLGAVERSWDILWGVEGLLEAQTFLLDRAVPVSENLATPVRGLIPVRPPTHPATDRNIGRPPPTARWQPARQKRQYMTLTDRVMGYMRQSGEMPFDFREEREYYEEEQETFESEQDDYDVESFRPRRAGSVSEYSVYSEYSGDQWF